MSKSCTREIAFAMNPMTSEMHEEPGNADSLFLILGWFAFLLLLYWLTGVLRLPYRISLALWAACNFGPVVWLAFRPHAQLAAVVGLLVVAYFSYLMGASLFEQRDRERRAKQEFEKREREELFREKR
jgi:hypothetical protein